MWISKERRKSSKILKGWVLFGSISPFKGYIDRGVGLLSRDVYYLESQRTEYTRMCQHDQAKDLTSGWTRGVFSGS